ncbi:hypothetical protein, partial [Methanopyrus kandleri]
TTLLGIANTLLSVTMKNPPFSLKSILLALMICGLQYKLVVIPVMEAIAFGGKPKHWSAIEELQKRLFKSFLKMYIIAAIRLLLFGSVSAESMLVNFNATMATYVGAMWVSTAIVVGIKALEAVESGTGKAVKAGVESCAKYSSNIT